MYIRKKEVVKTSPAILSVRAEAPTGITLQIYE